MYKMKTERENYRITDLKRSRALEFLCHMILFWGEEKKVLGSEEKSKIGRVTGNIQLYFA